MSYAKAIRLARTKAGVSKRKLALLAGVSPSYVTHLEAGRRDPSLATLRKFSDVLEVPPLLLHLWAAQESELRNNLVKELLHDAQS